MCNRLIPSLAIGFAVLAAGCSGDAGTAPTTERTIEAESVAAVTNTENASAECPTEGDDFETAKLYVEHNATDADTGVHGLFGGHGWRELCISNPAGELILKTTPIGPLHDLAVADLFFESREPPNDEVAIVDIQNAFPAGEYTVAGTDFEGIPRVGAAHFSHAIPTEPSIKTPELAEDAETAGDAVVPSDGLVVSWEPVTHTIDGVAANIVGYEVIVTKDDHDDQNALSRPIYDVHVGPEFTSLAVPAAFFEPDTVYELEVLALEESGNQTISLGFFTTAPAGRALDYEDVSTFIEYNAGAGDLGFHIEFGGEPWTSATITDPKGTVILDLAGSGGLAQQGLAGVFAESGEYPFAEVSRGDFLSRFPAGEYLFEGRTVEGDTLVAAWEFSHLIPDAPTVANPAEAATVDAADVTISWEDVTTPQGVEVEVYQLQLYPIDPEPGQEPIDLNVDYTLEVPASITSIQVPAQILAPGAEYEFELAAVDANGNRTFAIGHFATSP